LSCSAPVDAVTVTLVLALTPDESVATAVYGPAAVPAGTVTVAVKLPAGAATVWLMPNALTVTCEPTVKLLPVRVVELPAVRLVGDATRLATTPVVVSDSVPLSVTPPMVIWTTTDVVPVATVGRGKATL
jgi:hypothetical protein